MPDPFQAHAGRGEHAIVDRPAVGGVEHLRSRFQQQLVVGKAQPQDIEPRAGIGLARTGMRAEDIVRIQAPAPPFAHRACRQVADDADALAGKVTEQRAQHGHQQIPQQRRLAADGWRVVPHRTAADRDVDQPVQQPPRGQQRRALAAETVAEREQRPLRLQGMRRLQHGVVILPLPLLERTGRAAHGTAQRFAGAAVVEGPGDEALRRQPFGEGGIEVLLDRHRRSDHHAALGFAHRVVAVRGQRVAVGGRDGERAHGLRPATTGTCHTA